MDQPIVLRLTLEHMQHSILQVLYPREVDLKERIEQAIQQAMTTFDFEAEIHRQVQMVLQNTIHTKVDYMVREALSRQQGPRIEQLIQAEVERQLKEHQR